MALQDIVNVSITRGSKSVSQAGFGTPLVLGTVGASFGTDKVRIYSSLAGVAADFLTSDSIYKAAVALFGQQLKPTRIMVGKRTVAAAQVVTITPVVANSQLYTITVNGVAYTFTSSGSATAASIVTGLIAAITDTSVAKSGTNTLVLTAAAAGTPFTVLGDANLPQVLTTPNNGVVEDIQSVQSVNDDWYMLILVSRTQADIQNAASYIETQRKMFAACTSDAAVLTTSTTDVMSVLKQKSYARTFVLYSADQANFPEAAWAGGVLPMPAGSETWKFKTLVGITPDDGLSVTQVTNIKAKFGNYYQTVAGVAITAEGWVAANEWIDVIRFIDQLQAWIQQDIYAQLVSVPKIPYTDPGVAVIEMILRSDLQRGIRAGGLAANPAPNVFVPKVADVAALDRKNRHLPNVSFTANLAGAIHDLVISGVVSV